jgi:hypothetical protein
MEPLTTLGVVVVINIIVGLVIKYLVTKSLDNLEKIPVLESRITVLEQETKTKQTDFKSLEGELRSTRERLIKVETLLETLIESIKHKL